MRVLDASVLVEYLTDGEHAESSRRHLTSSPGWLWASFLVDAVVADLMEMRLQRVSHHPLAERAWELRENVSFYDELHVALAEQLEAPLVALDSRLAKATGVRAEIELIQAA